MDLYAGTSPHRTMVSSGLRLSIAACLLASVVQGFDVDGCTSVVVSAGATVDGSAFASHANDCADCDWRVVYVPAKDHEKGSKRIVYDAVWSQYPRLVDTSRSKQYAAGAGINSSKILGSIPQVEHTYALWEASYGLMNEHGLGLGESTCPAFLVGKSVADGGNDLFSIGNLMNIALERCKTARCAIKLMGELGSKYGFYGEDPGIAGGGEAVSLVDKTGEAWVFHISGGVPNDDPAAPWAGQRGALWVAQRVPEGHVAVIANSNIIRRVDVHDSENFLAHPGLLELVQEAGLWDGTGPFDWQLALQPDLGTFSYFPGLAPIPMYSTLRMWGIYRQAAPNAGLKATPVLNDFPFSVPVDKKVTTLEVMQWFRTHYEGTEFDMRLGSLAGPWQTPNRAEGGQGAKTMPGQFARATSIPRTSYTVLLQSGISHPIAWFAPDASASSVFVPFFSAALSEGGDGNFDLESYGTGSMKSFSFITKPDGMAPAWWAHDFVANWMDLSYQNMSETYVYPAVQRVQRRVVEEAAAAIKESAGKSTPESAATLATAQSRIQRGVVTEWWQMAEMLIVRYNDQFFNFGESAPQSVASIGYPSFWLEMIGYNQEFYRPHWLQPAYQPPSLLPVQDLQALAAHGTDIQTPEEAQATSVVPDLRSGWTASAVAAACVLSAGLGHVIGYRRGSSVRAHAEDDYRKLTA